MDRARAGTAQTCRVRLPERPALKAGFVSGDRRCGEQLEIAGETGCPHTQDMWSSSIYSRFGLAQPRIVPAGFLYVAHRFAIHLIDLMTAAPGPEQPDQRHKSLTYHVHSTSYDNSRETSQPATRTRRNPASQGSTAAITANRTITRANN